MADLDFLMDSHEQDFRDSDRYSGLLNFWTLDDHDIPREPGAYFLYARGTRFVYPKGKNAVFYIGQSVNLRARLTTHLKFSLEARENRRNPEYLYYPRYEYASRVGTHYGYIRTKRGMTPTGLEEILMTWFARQHRSFPVANGTGSWKRIYSYLRRK